MSLCASFAVAFVLALAFTPLAIWLAPKIGAMDIPKDDRRVHTKSMPRFGGMAIFIGVMVSVIFFVVPEKNTTGIVIAGTLIYDLGVVDDLKGLGPKVKFIGQGICAIIVYLFDIRVAFIGNLIGDGNLIFGDVVSFIVTVIWIVGISNSVNLIDGLDGLAAGISAIASLCIAFVAYNNGQYLVTYAMLAVAGGALGFLPFNFHPAKIFMGDSGSLFLGFCLATFSLIGPTKGATVVAVAIPALVLGLPIFDTLFAMLRRTIRGQSIVTADKEHLHHRIMRAGFGQRRSVMLMYCISGIMGVVAVEFSRSLLVDAIGLLAVAIMLLYVLLSDTSTKKVEINAVNIAKEESKEKKKRHE